MTSSQLLPPSVVLKTCPGVRGGLVEAVVARRRRSGSCCGRPRTPATGRFGRTLPAGDALPGRVVADLGVGADVDEAVQRARCRRAWPPPTPIAEMPHSARAVRRRARAAGGQVGADRRSTGRRRPTVRLRVVGAVEPVRPEEQLVRVRPGSSRTARRSPSGRTGRCPSRDAGVGEERRSAVGDPVRRDPEVRPVDEAASVSAELAHGHRGRRAPARRRRSRRRTNCSTRPTCAPCRCPASRPRSAPGLRNRRDRSELRARELVLWVTAPFVGVDGPVQVDPGDCAQRIRSGSAGRRGCCCTRRRRREPISDAAPGWPRSNANAWKSGCWSQPEVLPRLAAVVGAEDAARADVVVELAGREDDVRVRRVDLDHVVVEALPPQ